MVVLYSALDCPATETAMMRVTNDTLNLLASMTLSLLLLDVRIGRADCSENAANTHSTWVAPSGSVE
jgi:hypothetical protein